MSQRKMSSAAIQREEHGEQCQDLIDRLARSTFDLFGMVKQLVDAKAQSRFFLEGVGRLRHQHRTPDDCVLGGLADVERDLIHTRTAEGRSRANAQGKHMGSPPTQQKEAIRRRAQGATLQELAHSYNVGRATISRLKP
jgi:DNA invertase Pin-like site-specific DNA recombinase